MTVQMSCGAAWIRTILSTVPSQAREKLIQGVPYLTESSADEVSDAVALAELDADAQRTSEHADAV